MTIKKFRSVLILFFLFVSLLPVQTVLADTGPKPTMDFNFKGLDDGELQIISGILYECDQADCSDAKPLEVLGPQRLTCTTIGCHALAYGFAPYHILEVEFSDEVTRRSNIFETAGFEFTYNVTIQPNDLLVESQFSLGVISPYTWLLVVVSLCCLVGFGLTVGIIIFVMRRVEKK
ncbi:MAG: hypothetical protein QM730_08480 [Anaerolineales bacterium]